MEIKDLNLNEDILPLFDYTQNDDARVILKKLLLTPLNNKSAAIARQDTLKGFLKNISVFSNYTYSRLDFREVQSFLKFYSDKQYLIRWLYLNLYFSKRRYFKYRGHCIQLIILYNRLYNNYFKKINYSYYPEAYRKELRFIEDYLSSFRTSYYKQRIDDGKFNIKDIISIIKIISQRKSNFDIENFYEKFSYTEAYTAAALGICNNNFTFPEFTDGNFSVENLYNPLLQNAVKNSFTTNSNVILLTGPNMSGKSTLLKAIALCVYLGNIGFAVPASKAQMPFYDNISAFINLNDNLKSGYSHFMTEIHNLKKVVIQAGTKQNCFALFDELFRGTNMEDALEITKTTLKGLLNFPQSLFLISSHIDGLTELEEIKEGKIECYYLECNLKNQMPEFTYQLKKGSATLKIGRILFEKENINDLLKR